MAGVYSGCVIQIMMAWPMIFLVLEIMGEPVLRIKNGYLYASSDDNIYRYKMDNNEVSASSAEEMIVEGLLNKREHSSKSITLDNNGFIYVNIGAPSNACQEKNREKGSPGMTPCPILDSAGGIWQFRIG